MASIRILHASDLHISARPKSYTSVVDRVSAALSLKRLRNTLKHPATSIGNLRRTALVSTYEQALLSHFAKLIYDDCNNHPIHNLGTPVDAIILTGDLATTGLQKDLERVSEFLDGPPSATNPAVSINNYPTLGGVNRAVLGDRDETLPVWILPGNHDRYRRVAPTPNSRFTIDYSPGGRNFERILSNYWGHPFSGLPDHGPDVLEFPTLIKDSLHVTIIAADFNLKDKHDRVGVWYHKYAQGRVYPAILKRLIEATRDARNRYRDEHPHVILWAIHFPPEFPKATAAMRLIDEDLLLQAATNLRVGAILSGHTHKHLFYKTALNTRQRVVCAGTATQSYAPTGRFFGIVEIDADAEGHVFIGHECFRYKKRPADFVRVRCSARRLRRISKL